MVPLKSPLTLKYPREVTVLPLAVIDGQEVADKGRTFALLPGCHSFRLLRTIGQVSARGGGGYAATLPQRVFSLDVQPGHSYLFHWHYPALGSVIHPVYAPDASNSWGIFDHRRDGSARVARACDGSALPPLPNVR